MTPTFPASELSMAKMQRNRSDERREILYRERGIFPKCQRCGRSCKVLLGKKGKLLCYEFEAKKERA